MDNRTLYVTDLDGTLLNGRAQLSEFTRETLNSLLDQGLLLTYATARSLTSASKAVEGLHITLPVITYNGAIVADPLTGEPMLDHFLDREVIQPVLEMLMETGAPVLVYAYVDGVERVSWMRSSESAGVRGYLQARRGDPRLRPCESYRELFAGELFYFTAIGKRERMTDLYDRMAVVKGCQPSLLHDTYNPEEWWLEIYRKGVSKAAAIQTVRQTLEADRLVCFGDHLNDLSMFRISDECYAVANAGSKVRESATAVIGCNEEDGVAKWLLEHAGQGEMICR